MAVKLAPDTSSDAEITDGVGRGDVGAAGRLWTRFWPVALGTARELVEPAEVPGLAAEALIGTIASIAVGRGPREEVATFIEAAVRELGEDDEPVPADRGGVVHPDVFTSPLMSRAFAGLSPEFQTVLWDGAERPEAEEALTALQSGYVELHAEGAEPAACRQAHQDLAGSVSNPTAISTETWVHLSSCAWCTEAFHELAFSSIAITALVDPALVARTTVVTPAPIAGPIAVPVAVPINGLDEVTVGAGVADPAIAPDADPDADTIVIGAPGVPAALTLPAARAVHDDTSAAVIAGRRRRIVAVVAGVAAVGVIATAVIAIAVSSQGSKTKTPAAGNNPTNSTTLAGATQSPSPSGIPTTLTPSASPTTSAGAVTPTASPTSGAAVNNPTALATSPATKPTSGPTTRPTTRPTTKPTTSPSTKPTATPTTPSASPTPTPTPSPTPTPKPTCSPLAHLLGFC